jgi:hypothetical protein
MRLRRSILRVWCEGRKEGWDTCQMEAEPDGARDGACDAEKGSRPSLLPTPALLDRKDGVEAVLALFKNLLLNLKLDPTHPLPVNLKI